MVGRRAWWIPALIFLASRVVGAVLILAAGARQAPRAEVDPDFRRFLVSPATYAHLIQAWDGEWYRRIAESGYPTTLPTQGGVVTENTWAFYPIFPVLVLVVMATGLSFAVAASVVSLMAGLTAVCLCYAMVEDSSGRFVAVLAAVGLCMAPAAPILQMAYSDALALAWMMIAFWGLRQRRYWVVAVGCLLLALTRPVVLPMALVIALHGVLRWRRRATDPFPPAERWALASVVVLTSASFALWPLVCGLVTGEPGGYLATQRAWGGDRNGDLVSWLSIAVDSGPAAVLTLVAILASVAFLVLRPVARIWPGELRSWTLAYVGYVLAVTVPSGAIVRYALPAVLVWSPTPGLAQRAQSRGARVLLVGVTAVLGAALQWWWLTRFFVITPDWISHP